jgi:hypothetical protein
MSLLFCIDAYISNQERADVCSNLIKKIRKIYPEKKILIINKFRQSWDLDKEVDYYYFHGQGFLVGAPPEELIKSGKYEWPYTYFRIPHGTIENWFPLTNVSDHVADVYNSFILAANIGKTLGYAKVFKIEYDTVFNDEEFAQMRADIENFEDYLFYGIRKEGSWAKSYQYLIDVHIIGFSTELFEGFSIVNNDREFWDLCKRINYYGKWVEYVIPMILEYLKRTHKQNLKGIEHHVPLRELYPGSKFDAISSPGEWSTAWDIVPKICRVSSESHDQHAAPNEIVVFYSAQDKHHPFVDAECKITSLLDNRIIYEKTACIKPGGWMFDHLFIHEPIEIEIINKSNNISTHNKYTVQPDEIGNIYPRFVFST